MQTETPPRPPRSRRSAREGAAVAVSLVVHGAALGFLLLSVRPDTTPVIPGPVLDVSLAPAPHPQAKPAPSRPAEPSPVRAKAAARAVRRPAAAAASAAPRTSRPARRAPATATLAEGRGAGASVGADAVGDAELAGSTVAGGGGGGGGECDMAARLQAALRRDRLVRAAVAPLAASPHRAFKVWNGDWIAHTGEDGRGLAAVREAILWEVGFSPPACRMAVVHGLVVLDVATEGGGEVRLALGTGQWRWSDLLGLGARSAG